MCMVDVESECLKSVLLVRGRGARALVGHDRQLATTKVGQLARQHLRLRELQDVLMDELVW